MKTALTPREERYARDLIRNSTRLQAVRWPEWAGLVLLSLGGFVTAVVCLITAGNLHTVSITYVLFPGITIGMGLMLAGTFIQRRSRRFEEQKVLASLVGKLMAQRSVR